MRKENFVPAELEITTFDKDNITIATTDEGKTGSTGFSMGW